jgi:type IV secretion system protein VirB9
VTRPWLHRVSAHTGLICTALLLLAGRTPVAVAGDARLRVVDFDPSAVVSLTAFVGYHVHLEFAPDEHFVNLGSGDTSAIDVGAEGNHLLLKPRAPIGGTNLTIITNRHAYYLDYRAVARVPRADEATYSIAFRYPTVPMPASVGADAIGTGGRLDAMPPERNRDYWYCGNPQLRPVAAVDDGLQLRLTFAPNAELPTIYAIDADGAEMLVNTHVENDTIFVHRLAPHFVLRRGKAIGCVVDRGRHVDARRAGSGTVDDATKRALRPREP